MWQAITLSLLSGIFLGNGIPHFIKGITRETYPMVFSNKPVPNLIAGWSSFIIASIFGYYAGFCQHLFTAFLSASVGILLIGLFHAGPGAFGKGGEAD